MQVTAATSAIYTRPVATRPVQDAAAVVRAQQSETSQAQTSNRAAETRPAARSGPVSVAQLLDSRAFEEIAKIQPVENNYGPRRGAYNSDRQAGDDLLRAELNRIEITRDGRQSGNGSAGGPPVRPANGDDASGPEVTTDPRLDVTPVFGNPELTIQKMETVRRTLSSSDSAEEQFLAARAEQIKARAEAEMRRQEAEARREARVEEEVQKLIDGGDSESIGRQFLEASSAYKETERRFERGSGSVQISA